MQSTELERPPAPSSPSPLLQFFDSFLQEKNIKWVLSIGTLILFGSSLMLVASHWQSYTPVWKYLIMFATTGLIYVAGQWSYHRLALRRTGSVLMGLSVLLPPPMFVALHWIGLGVGAGGVLLGFSLWTLTLLFTAYSSRKIFRHFLRGDQTTFVLSYLLLAAAGSFVPVIPAAWAAPVALILWFVFAAGTVKVGRHIFWLVEEYQQPRVFGFFPIALCGGQLILLFATGLAQHLGLQWIGFGAALVAIPVLLTADSVVHVFQQRTGDLLRPLPGAVVAPLIAGIILCITGVALAGTGLMPPGLPYAVVPTTAIVAALMGLVAHRIQKSAFVWAMLASVVVAYNFSPVFFTEIARAVVDAGAGAVNEARLPYPFYGLTYLPLIAVFTAVAYRLERAGKHLFAVPMRRFSAFLTLGLLFVSFGHNKATFPVAVASLAVFATHLVLFRQRRMVLAGLGALLVAALGAGKFADTMFGVHFSFEADLARFIAVATFCFWPAALWERRLLASEEADAKTTISGRVGAGLTLLLAAVWTLRHLIVPVGLPGVLTGVALATLGLLYAWRLRRTLYTYAACTVVLAVVGVCVTSLLSAAWIPVAWSLLALGTLPIRERLRDRESPLAEPLDVAASAVLAVVAVLTVILVAFAPRLGGFFATAGLWIEHRRGGKDWPGRAALLIAPWQVLGTVVSLCTTEHVSHVFAFSEAALSACAVPVALAAVIAAAVIKWVVDRTDMSWWGLTLNRAVLLCCAVDCLALTLVSPSLRTLSPVTAAAAALAFGVGAADQIRSALRRGSEARVWIAQLIVGAGIGYLAFFDIIHFGRGLSMYIMMGVAVVWWALAQLAERDDDWRVVATPLRQVAMVLPAMAAAWGVLRHVGGGYTIWLGQNSLALLLAAAFYFWQGIERGRNRLVVFAAGILNVAFMLLWNELTWSDPQFYMVPVGISILALTRFLQDEIPKAAHSPLFYLGSLVILVSPTFNIVGGSWLHLFSLMVASVAIFLVAIGLRLRPLVYMGTAFLIADLIAIVVRGSIGRPSVLWISGVLLGAGVLALGALAERNRELLLQQIRAVSSELSSWD